MNQPSPIFVPFSACFLVLYLIFLYLFVWLWIITNKCFFHKFGCLHFVFNITLVTCSENRFDFSLSLIPRNVDSFIFLFFTFPFFHTPNLFSVVVKYFEFESYGSIRKFFIHSLEQLPSRNFHQHMLEQRMLALLPHNVYTHIYL